MNTRDYLTKIHTHLKDRSTYKLLIFNQTSAIVIDTCSLIEYIHFQHIVDKAPKELLLPLKYTGTPLFYGPYPKFTSKVALSGPLFLGVMVQLNISLPISSISSSPQPATSHHTSKTQNIFSTSLKNSHASHSMPSWSQLMPRSYTQTFQTKKGQRP